MLPDWLFDLILDFGRVLIPGVIALVCFFLAFEAAAIIFAIL